MDNRLIFLYFVRIVNDVALIARWASAPPILFPTRRAPVKLRIGIFGDRMGGTRPLGRICIIEVRRDGVGRSERLH